MINMNLSSERFLVSKYFYWIWKMNDEHFRNMNLRPGKLSVSYVENISKLKEIYHSPCCHSPSRRARRAGWSRGCSRWRWQSLPPGNWTPQFQILEFLISSSPWLQSHDGVVLRSGHHHHHLLLVLRPEAGRLGAHLAPGHEDVKIENGWKFPFKEVKSVIFHSS